MGRAAERQSHSGLCGGPCVTPACHPSLRFGGEARQWVEREADALGGVPIEWSEKAPRPPDYHNVQSTLAGRSRNGMKNSTLASAAQRRNGGGDARDGDLPPYRATGYPALPPRDGSRDVLVSPGQIPEKMLKQRQLGRLQWPGDAKRRLAVLSATAPNGCDWRNQDL